jgi:hypothetical protein
VDTGIESDVYVEAVSEYTSSTTIEAGSPLSIQCATNECCAPTWEITGSDLPVETGLAIDANGLITGYIPWTGEIQWPHTYYIDVTLTGPYKSVTRTVYVAVTEPSYFGNTWTGLGDWGAVVSAFHEGDSYCFFGTMAGKLFYSPTADLTTKTEIAFTGTNVDPVMAVLAMASDDHIIVLTQVNATAAPKIWVGGRTAVANSLVTAGQPNSFLPQLAQKYNDGIFFTYCTETGFAGNRFVSIRVFSVSGAMVTALHTIQNEDDGGSYSYPLNAPGSARVTILCMRANYSLEVWVKDDLTVPGVFTLRQSLAVTGTLMTPVVGYKNGTFYALIGGQLLTSGDGVTWGASAITVPAPGASAGRANLLILNGRAPNAVGLYFVSTDIYRTTDLFDTSTSKLVASATDNNQPKFIQMSDRRIMAIGISNTDPHHAYVSTS